jgi:hypothetical protein
MVEQLELPRTVIVENLFFSPRENTELVVGWYSRFRDDRNLPKQFALDELNDIKKRYKYFLRENPGLFTYLEKRKLKFQLSIDDGKGAYARTAMRLR